MIFGGISSEVLLCLEPSGEALQNPHFTLLLVLLLLFAFCPTLEYTTNP